MVIVWRLRGNIIRMALCWIVWQNVHSPQHTYISSSYRSNRLGLSHWDPYASSLRDIFTETVQCTQPDTATRGRGAFGGLFPIFTMGNAIGSPTMKCFRLVPENLTFPFRKHIVGKIDSWAFWRYIQFHNQSWGLWEISKKVTLVIRQLRPTQQRCVRNMHIYECTPRRNRAPPTARVDCP